MADCSHWYGTPPEGCDVPHWIPYMTESDLGLPQGSKLVLEPDSERTDTDRDECDEGEAA